MLQEVDELPSRASTLYCPDPDWSLVRAGTCLFLVGDRAAQWVAAGALIESHEDTYELPAPLSAVADEVIAQRLAGRLYFNGAKARVVRLPSFPGDQVVLGRATYRDQQVTHEAGTSLIRLSGGSEVDVLSLWTSPAGEVLPLEKSRMPQTFGVSVLCLTSDYRAIFSTRSSLLAVEPGRLDTTSSGGCEPHSGKSSAFLSYLREEALRELEEESGIVPKEVSRLSLATVTRNLQRGGLLDFHFLALLSSQAAPVPGEELTNFRYTRALQKPADFALALKGACTKHKASANLHALAAVVTAAASNSSHFVQTQQALNETWSR